MNRDETTNPIADRSQFVQHLERASGIVQSWPSWKRTILGNVQLGHTIGVNCPPTGTENTDSFGNDAKLG
jgi:hypothetical protein